MNRQPEIKDKLVIKNATLRLDDYVFFACTLILLYFIFTRDNTSIIVLIFIGLLAYTTYSILKRFSDRSEKIIIDKNGITLCENNDLIVWSKIKYSYIKQKSEGVGRSAKVVDYFHIDTKEGEIRVRMAAFKYNKEILKLTVERFSGRNIGDLTDLLNDNAKKIIGTERHLDELSAIFTTFYKRQMNLFTLLFLVPIAISIYLQFKIDFPYVFTIGFTLTIIIIFLFGLSEESGLRNKEYIQDLDEKKYQALKNEYGSAHELSQNKKQEIMTYVLIIAFAIGVFGISYMFSREKQNREKNKIEKVNSLHNK